MEENHKHEDKRVKFLWAAAVCVAELGLEDSRKTKKKFVG